MERAGPLVYLTFFLLVAYSLSSGNAGTSFRYRVQIVSLFICLISALWWPAERRRAIEAPSGVEKAPMEPAQA
jgi:hypothetical protein